MFRRWQWTHEQTNEHSFCLSLPLSSVPRVHTYSPIIILALYTYSFSSLTLNISFFLFLILPIFLSHSSALYDNLFISIFLFWLSFSLSLTLFPARITSQWKIGDWTAPWWTNREKNKWWIIWVLCLIEKIKERKKEKWSLGLWGQKCLWLQTYQRQKYYFR